MALAIGMTIVFAPAAGRADVPSPRSRHTAIYDAPRHRMIVFGGYRDDSTQTLNDTWALTLGDVPAWQPLSVTGEVPSIRFGHSAIYDPRHDRMIVFGGFAADSDCWLLDLTSLRWDRLIVPGPSPSPRYYHSAVYDSADDQMIVFGGETAIGKVNDVWALDLSGAPAWHRLVPNGSGSGRPSKRSSHTAIYDRMRQRMIVFGGFVATPVKDTWSLALPAAVWTHLAADGPESRDAHTAVYDPPGDRMLVFAGFGANNNNSEGNNTWALALGTATWSSIVPPSGLVPSPRQQHTAILDTLGRMVVFGGRPVDQGSTWSDEAVWALRDRDGNPEWAPLRPVVAPSDTNLVVPPVSVGTTTSVSFTIRNAGLSPLQVHFDLPSDMSVTVPEPPILRGAESLTETLSCSPTPGTVRQTTDSLIIVTNDPFRPRQRVGLQVQALGLDFDSRFLSGDQAPLGDSLIAVVTPHAHVHLDGGTLFYRVSDGRSGYEAAPLTSLVTDFIAGIPPAAVTEWGLDYYIVVQGGAYSDTLPHGGPSTPLKQLVAPPASLLAHARAGTSGGFPAGDSFRVDVELPLGSVFESGTLHVRRGGEAAWTTVPLQQTGGAIGAEVPDGLVGARGIEYWVESTTLQLQTLDRTLRFPAADTSFAVVPVTLLKLVEPTTHEGGRYRLLGVPLEFGGRIGLGAILSEQLGAYDPVHWRAFEYDPARGNVELSSPSSLSVVPGRGFWLVTLAAHTVDTYPVVGTSVPTDAPFAIPLEPGWNLIGNPFDFPVAWANVRHGPLVADSLVAFDPGLGTIGGYSHVPPTVLEPFEGYFILDRATASDPPETLWVAPRADETLTAASRPATMPRSRVDAAGWSLLLDAHTEHAEDRGNEVGVSTLAQESFDRLDRPKPPAMPGAWVSLAAVHPEWGRWAGRDWRDLRPAGTEGETWDLEATSSAAGEPITIDLRRALAPPPGWIVRLLDRELGTSTDLAGGSVDPRGTPLTSVRIVSMGPARPYRLALVAGTPAYVARAIQPVETPARLVLDANAPNPFHGATRFRFGLPRPARVSLEIFDVTGKRVATLLDRAPLAPGYHATLWDGAMPGGDPAPSGMYWLRLSAEGMALTRRIVRVL